MKLLRRRSVRSDARASLLFVSPVMPALHGNGLAMRAAYTLLALAARYRVSLLVLPFYASPAGRHAPESVRAACESVTVMAGTISADSLPVGDVDILHLFRLETVRPADPLLTAFRGRARLWLDLDDVESLVHQRLAGLHQSRGEEAAANAELELASAAEAREVDALQRFERVFLASAADADRLPLLGAADVRHLPNVLPLPPVLPDAPARGPIDILMIGTLGYFPNAEGALWFASDVLPRIHRQMGAPALVRVAGSGWLPLVEELRRVPYVEVVGSVPDVRPVYERAQLVVAPLRAGGGSRIKLIEAFGLGRAVVSTTIGAEGIDVIDGEHLLLADDSESFAAACQRLLADASLRASLILNARELTRQQHTLEAAAASVAGWP